MIIIIVKEVMTCDVLPVAMFFIVMITKEVKIVAMFDTLLLYSTHNA